MNLRKKVLYRNTYLGIDRHYSILDEKKFRYNLILGGNTMFEGLLKTEDNIGYFFARIALGAVILPHGLQKTVGMFGGHGFSGTVEAFVGWVCRWQLYI